VMESTAQCLKPVWLALEGSFDLHLAQAGSNLAPRGRKTDFGDAERSPAATGPTPGLPSNGPIESAPAPTRSSPSSSSRRGAPDRVLPFVDHLPDFCGTGLRLVRVADRRSFTALSVSAQNLCQWRPRNVLDSDLRGCHTAA
jgi:hypothetical protein